MARTDIFNKLAAVLTCCGFFLLPAVASAYVGPGAGLSLLGALWALLVAVGTAIVFVLAWPVRRMMRRKREERERAERQTEREAAARAEARHRRQSAGPTGTDSPAEPEDVVTSERQ